MRISCMHALLMGAVIGAPAAITHADDPLVSLEFLGRYDAEVFDESAAEICAYDPASQRLFVINGFENRIDVLSLTVPSVPMFVDSFSVDAFGDGPNSVAVKNGIVAVAVEGNAVDAPGTAAFFNTNGDPLNSVEVGVLPDMITFTPDGMKVLTANEGEPNEEYTIDPEGSVSIIDISNGVENITQADVSTAGFDDFELEDIDPDIRIFGPGATVAQDLEPEYIAISADSSTAWVACQENNALAVVDIDTATVTALVALGFKEHFSGQPQLDLHYLTDLPVLGTTAAGQDILLGGFSGMYYNGINPDNGNWQFIVHPDRGPNADKTDVDGDGVNERPFPLPDFQAKLVFLELDRDSGVLSIVDELPLFRGDGVTPVSGLPNVLCTEDGLAYTDEEPVDVFGDPLSLDPLGGDFEGIVRAEDGTYWMVDEYRPAIYHFFADGTLNARYVPEGTGECPEYDETGIQALPQVYAQRRANRGFEAVAYQDGKIYAFIQSAIDNPDVPDDQNSKDSLNIRILEFDTATTTTTGEYLYIQDGDGSDKIGDAVSTRPGEFLVLERDSAIGEDAIKKVHRISLDGATDLSTLPDEIVGPGGSLEGLSEQELEDLGIVPVTKTLYADLGALGYNFVDKPEGLALIEPGVIAVINDNDFQLAGGLDTDTGLVDFLDPAPPIALGIVTFTGNGMDASDDDDMINIVSRPAYGMYQPDAIAAYEVDGETFIVSANEGDARDYDGFSEEERVDDLTLDPIAFPNADMLQQDEQLGRLQITTTLGDDDGDGDYDALYSYGARSMSIWNAAGELVWDSGDALEQLTATLLPDEFNSDNDENGSFDSRSDAKGPEPEGVTLATIDGLTFAFLGLERIGGIVVYNISDPYNPSFVQYINTRDFTGNPEIGTAGDLAPEGLIYISADDSPTGEHLLVVAYEVSGTTSVYRINTDLDGCEGLVGDLNDDCLVNGVDLLILLANWGMCGGDCHGDLNDDGVVDTNDLLLLFANWT